MNGRLMRAMIILLLVSIYVPVSVASEVATPVVTATPIAGGEIALSWTATGDSYKVYYNIGSDSIPPAPETVTTSTYWETAIGPGNHGQTVYFWVIAIVGEEESPAGSDFAVSDSEAPGQVTLISPENNDVLLTNSITFTWNSVADAASYELAYKVGTSNETTITGITSTSRTVNNLPNGICIWKVRAVDAAGNVGSNPATSFNCTINTNDPVLTSPANGSVFRSDEMPPTFSWQAVDGVLYYLNIYGDTGTLEVAYENISTNSYQPAYDFSVSDTYRWEVLYYDGVNYSDPSPRWSFTIDDDPPAAPTLSFPASGSTINDLTPSFSWSSVADADEYEIRIDTDDAFPSPVVSTDGITTTTHTIISSLADLNTYYWQVRAIDGAGNEGPWSSVFSFYVNSAIPNAPTLTSPINGAEVDNNKPLLSWSTVSGATSYTVEIATTDSFGTSTVYTKSALGSSSHSPTTALSNGDYYWRVRASSSAGNSDYSAIGNFTVNYEAPAADISFTVVVRSGSTGDAINSAAVKLLSGVSTVGNSTTDSLGRSTFSLPAGTYTLQVTKNLWDNGSGSDYTQSITISSTTSTVNVLLYEEGRDLIVATVRYNDASHSQPDSIIVYRNGSTYMTVTLPRVPPGILPANLVSALTNLVLSVPDSGTYTIADPDDPEGAVPVSQLSSSLSSAYNNAITLSVTSSVTGLIVDEQGSIVTGASVWLLRPEEDGTKSIIGVPVESSTIGFIFNYLLPDTYVIKVTKDGFDEYWSDEFEVGTNETKNLTMIVLTQQKGTINVTVQDAEGDLLPNARVIIKNSAGTTVFNQLAPQGIVGTELIPGSYTVSATLEGYEVTQQGTAVVSIGAAASATVVMGEAEPPPPETGSFQLTLTDADGNPLQLVEVFTGGTKVGVTNQEGVLLLEDLEVGTYTFTFTKDGYLEGSADVTIVAGETATTSTSLEIEQPVDDGSGTNYLLYGAIAVIVVAIAGAVLFMKKRSAEEGSIISDGSRPATGPRSMPPPETVSPPEATPRPRVMPRERGLPQSAGGSGLPTSSKRKEQYYSGSNSTSGIPNSSIKDDE
jgi:hypothetical protein